MQTNNQPKSQKKAVPLKEGLFTVPSPGGEGGHLIGSRCKSCGDVFFPKRDVCLSCGQADMEETALNTRGKLEAWTVVRQTPTGAIVTAPYGLGRIELLEGVFVATVLTDCDLEKLKSGTEWELVIEKVKEDEEGNDVMAYKFRPAQGL